MGRKLVMDEKKITLRMDSQTVKALKIIMQKTDQTHADSIRYAIRLTARALSDDNQAAMTGEKAGEND